MVSPREEGALAEFSSWVCARFGGRIRELALFGSRARGDGHLESDLDVLVVVDNLSSSEAREIAQFRGDLLTSHDIWLAPFAVSTERMSTLRARERLIASEIDRDAKPL